MTQPLKQLPSVEPIWLVAFSGHRPDEDTPGRKAADIESCRTGLREVLGDLQASARKLHGTIELLCGPAEGADQLALAVAAELGIPVHLMLPLPLSALRRDFEESPAAWDKVTEAVRRAKDPQDRWTARVIRGSGHRPDCYEDTNLLMLELADALVAIRASTSEDEKPDPAKIGGTDKLVEMASRARPDMPCFVLDPRGQVPTPSASELELDKDTAARLEDLTEDLQSRQAYQSEEDWQRGGEDPVWDVHRALDNVANNEARRFRGSLVTSIYLHFAATFLATVAAAFYAYWKDLKALLIGLTALELVLVLLATLAMWLAHKRQANKTWRRARLAAELVDGQILSAGLRDPLRPIILRYDRTWKPFALSVSLAAHHQRDRRVPRGAEAPAKRRFEYLDQRLRVQKERYFAKQRKESQTLHKSFGRLGQIASFAAVIAISLALAVKVGKPPGYGHPAVTALMLFFPVFLPLLANVASALTLAKDAARRSSRYEPMGKSLERYEALLEQAEPRATVERLVSEAEEVLLEELIEWHGSAGSMGH